MILVDTSVWIDFFTDTTSPYTETLSEWLRERRNLCINSLIEMEILQGIRNERQHSQAKQFLQPFLYYRDVPYGWLEDAEKIYRQCRKRGITIRKSIDCIIAANALQTGDYIFHRDRDFDAIARVFKELKTNPI